MQFRIEDFIKNYLKTIKIAYVFKLNPKLENSLQKNVENEKINETELMRLLNTTMNKKTMSNALKSKNGFITYFKNVYSRCMKMGSSKSQYGGKEPSRSSLVNNILLYIVLIIFINRVSADVEPIVASNYCGEYGVGTIYYEICTRLLYLYNSYIWLGYVPPGVSFNLWLEWNGFSIEENDDETLINDIEQRYENNIIVPNIVGFLPLPPSPPFRPRVPSPTIDNQLPFLRQLNHFRESLEIHEGSFPEDLRRRREVPSVQQLLPAPPERRLLPKPRSPVNEPNYLPMPTENNLHRYLPTQNNGLLLPMPQQAEYTQAMGSVLIVVLMRIFSTRRITRFIDGSDNDNDSDDSFESARSSQTSNYEMPSENNTLQELLTFISVTNEERVGLRHFFTRIVSIQSIVRGNQSRRRLSNENKKALKIQKSFRGHISRKRQQTKRRISNENKKALKIQKSFRGHITKKREIHLERIYPKNESGFEEENPLNKNKKLLSLKQPSIISSNSPRYDNIYKSVRSPHYEEEKNPHINKLRDIRSKNILASQKPTKQKIRKSIQPTKNMTKKNNKFDLDDFRKSSSADSGSLKIPKPKLKYAFKVKPKKALNELDWATDSDSDSDGSNK
jgi:hypothetical protein